MSLTQHFKKLGAPLKNSRWSWGAVRESDGVVFLRVWQDQKVQLDGKTYMMVTHHAAYVGNESRPGYRERLAQVELVRTGSPVYMIVCIVEDPNARPRKIKSFIADDLFPGGEVIEHDGDTWIEQIGRVDRFSITK
jgi:hypothetical protein